MTPNSIIFSGADATEAFLATLPQFMRPYCSPLTPNKVEWVDGWVVETSGDLELDRILGEFYAVEVTRLANEQNNPSLVTFAIACLMEKSKSNQLTSEGAIESAFVGKLARMACAGSKN